MAGHKRCFPKASADWNEIAKAVRLRDILGKQVAIIGNGDVTSYGEAMRRVDETCVDGVMIGRGIFCGFSGPLPPETVTAASVKNWNC